MLTKKQKMHMAFQKGLKLHSPERKLIEKNPELIDAFIKGAALAIPFDNSLSKNVYLANSMIHNKKRDKKGREQELHRINTFVDESTCKISRRCFYEFFTRGYSSYRELKFIHMLFLSILAKYQTSLEKNSFERDNISVSYLIKYYRKNPQQIKKNMIYAPSIYLDNDKFHIRIGSLFSKVCFRIVKIKEIYTRARYGKYGLISLSKNVKIFTRKA